MFLWGLKNGWKEGLTRLDFKIWYIVDDKKTVERGLLLYVELAARPAKPRLGALPAPSDIFLTTLIATIVSGPMHIIPVDRSTGSTLNLLSMTLGRIIKAEGSYRNYKLVVIGNTNDFLNLRGTLVGNMIGMNLI